MDTMALHGRAGASGARRRGSEPPSNPALDLAMARVGDRWSLLIVDALLEQPRRFSDLQGAIPGLAPNVLSARLRRLEAAELIVGVPYSDRPVRLEYQATELSRSLAGALRLLAHWGASAEADHRSLPRHGACGTHLEARWYCPSCDHVTDRGDGGAVWI